jgi:hypothetical protein
MVRARPDDLLDCFLAILEIDQRALNASSETPHRFALALKVDVESQEINLIR